VDLFLAAAFLLGRLRQFFEHVLHGVASCDFAFMNGISRTEKPKTCYTEADALPLSPSPSVLRGRLRTAFCWPDHRGKRRFAGRVFCAGTDGKATGKKSHTTKKR